MEKNRWSILWEGSFPMILWKGNRRWFDNFFLIQAKSSSACCSSFWTQEAIRHLRFLFCHMWISMQSILSYKVRSNVLISNHTFKLKWHGSGSSRWKALGYIFYALLLQQFCQTETFSVICCQCLMVTWGIKHSGIPKTLHLRQSCVWN